MRSKIILFIAAGLSFISFLQTTRANDNAPGLLIGWASADITPDQPVLIAGQSHARVSEGVMDPVTATALALESDDGKSHMIMVSCDLGSIHETVRDGVRAILRSELPELNPDSILIFATHTHAAPMARYGERYRDNKPPFPTPYGIELPVMSPVDYVAWCNRRIADAVKQAWQDRKPGGIAYGIGQAVVGRNRLTAYTSGNSSMYGSTASPQFSHMEGYEDHSLYVLATYDLDRQLTGLIINLACPSQVSEIICQISADFWHDTRLELRRRLGDDLHILPQCAAAGDQSPHIMLNRKAEARMLYLKGLTTAMPGNQRPAGNAMRREIAQRIADGTTAILPFIEREINYNPPLRHRMKNLELPRRIIPESDRDNARAEALKARANYEAMLNDLNNHPEKRAQPRWYHNISRTHSLMRRHERVVERFELQQTQPYLPVEVHIARLGDVAFASSPFELYLDYGLRIQSRTQALQTFVIQLAGPGSYLPTERSVAGGAYGAVPASTETGPEGGQILVDWTVNAIDAIITEEQ